MKLEELAKRIRAHLLRFEADKTINVARDSGLRPYYHPYASRAGSYVRVTYVTFQGGTTLTKDEAQAYLDWLDAGNVGTHWRAQRTAKATAKETR